jgi:hypothetical protein
MRIALLVPVLAALAAFALPAPAAEWLYLTAPGDTLSAIGQTYLRNPKDWPKVQAANGVPIPKHLPANSRLKIPVELLKVTPAPVTVVAVSGNPRFKRTDGPYQPLKAGESLSGGETVLTGPGATVSYRFADDTRLTQQASSKLSFGRLASYGKTGMVSTELSLDSGRLEASASKQLAPAGGFQVHTPVAVAGLRGTGFRLNVAEDGKTMRNEVVEGAVAVSAMGEEVRVNAGFGTFAEQGKPPAPPVSLLPQPDLSRLPAVIMQLPLALDWPAHASARAWRVQLSSDPDFQTVMRDSVFNESVAQWDTGLEDGAYYLRIRGIDQFGLEGFDARHRFTLDARPLPPMPQKPALGEKIVERNVELVWTQVDGAQGYLLQLAPTPEFGSGLIERRLPLGDRTREVLTSGEWHWRIASLDEHGRTRAFSPHRAFGVFPPPLPAPPQSPSRLQAIEEAGVLAVGWSGDAPTYRLELSGNEAFSPLLSSHLVTAPQARLIKPAPGNYWLRVIALDKDRRESPPSPAVSVVVQHYKPWWLLPLLLLVS